jgi:hypothetical protein
MKKIILAFIFTSLFCQLLMAQNSEVKEKRQFYSGTILKKPWAKSAQSFCAQGSDYFVLKTNKNQEWVLENTSNTDLESLINKKVKITGFRRTKTIEATNDPMVQRPIEYDINGNEVKNADYNCEVLVITKIESR